MTDPALPDLHLALARIHFDAGRLDEASREITRELALVPFSREALSDAQLGDLLAYLETFGLPKSP